MAQGSTPVEPSSEELSASSAFAEATALAFAPKALTDKSAKTPNTTSLTHTLSRIPAAGHGSGIPPLFLGGKTTDLPNPGVSAADKK